MSADGEKRQPGTFGADDLEDRWGGSLGEPLCNPKVTTVFGGPCRLLQEVVIGALSEGERVVPVAGLELATYRLQGG